MIFVIENLKFGICARGGCFRVTYSSAREDILITFVKLIL